MWSSRSDRMRNSRITFFNCLMIVFALLIPDDYAAAGDAPRGNCTIGVFGRSVTSDGRPILWKNRDVGNFNQRFIFVESYQRDGIFTIPYIGNVYSSDSSRVYMGANAEGFAIVNSDSYNLGDTLNAGIDDGTLMRIALEICEDLLDFESLLDSTNVTGRKNCWNFGAMEATGECALYECRNQSYIKLVPDRSESSGYGYLIRANFSVSGGSSQTGFDRYKRAIELCDECLSGGLLDEQYILARIMRDLANIYDNPYPLPYFRSQAGGPDGYIYNYFCTISNRRTASAVVIKGVAPGEDPLLTTVYAVIGSPDLSLAYPLWVGAETVPIYLSRADSTPMYDYCTVRRERLYDNPQALFHLNSKALQDEFGEGFYSYTIPLESWGLARAGLLLDSWRVTTPSNYVFAIEQFAIARALFAGFQLETAGYVTEAIDFEEMIADEFHLGNYPNPFNGRTRISYDLMEVGSPVVIKIYDSLGRIVRSFAGTGFADDSVIWEGDDCDGNSVASGVYLYSLEAGSIRLTNKMTVIK